MRTRSLWLLALCTSLAGCAARQSSAPREEPRGNAIVVPGSRLSGNFLESLASHVPTMRVTRPRQSRAAPTQCPLISLRGMRTSQGQPDVYVDNTLMLDTCILDQVSSSDVDSVAVYVSGLAARPGLRGSPYGSILIFRRRE